MKKLVVLILSVMIMLIGVQSVLASDLVWAGWSGEEASTKPTVEKIIENYNNGGSGNTVTWVGWPWGDVTQQLVIRLQGGEQLDVAQLDSSMMSTIFQMDVCYETKDLFDEEFLSTLSEAGINYGIDAQGRSIGVPWTMSSIGMLYNPELLAKAGWDSAPTTLEEFEACCADLKAMDPDLIPYGLSTKDNTATADFQPWLWAHGGHIFDGDEITVNSDAAIETLSWYRKMAEAGYIQSNMSRFDARQLFAQGKIAFYDDVIGARGTAVSNGVPEDKIRDVISPMLRPVVREGDTPTSAMWGHVLVVFKNSVDPEASADFVKSIVSDENSLMYFRNTGALPVTASGLSNEEVVNDEWSKIWAGITATGQTNELMLSPYNAQFNNIISEEVQAVVIGDKTPEQAAADMESRMLSAMDD